MNKVIGNRTQKALINLKLSTGCEMKVKALGKSNGPIDEINNLIKLGQFFYEEYCRHIRIAKVCGDEMILIREN